MVSGTTKNKETSSEYWLEILSLCMPSAILSSANAAPHPPPHLFPLYLRVQLCKQALFFTVSLSLFFFIYFYFLFYPGDFVCVICFLSPAFSLHPPPPHPPLSFPFYPPFLFSLLWTASLIPKYCAVGTYKFVSDTINLPFGVFIWFVLTAELIDVTHLHMYSVNICMYTCLHTGMHTSIRVDRHACIVCLSVCFWRPPPPSPIYSVTVTETLFSAHASELPVQVRLTKGRHIVEQKQVLH